MAYSPTEDKYLSALTAVQFPEAAVEQQAPERPVLLASAAGGLPTGVKLTGEIKPIEQTSVERALQQAGIGLEQAGRFLDGLGQVQIPGTDIKISMADLVPFVGSAKDRSVFGTTWQGTPMALQQAGRGESLTRGTGFATQLTEDAKLAAFDAIPAGQAARTAGKTVAKGVSRATAKLTPQAGELGKRIATDFDSLVQEYSKLKDTNGGTVLSTDSARELSPAYLADRSKSAAVQDAASNFVEKLFREKLANPTPPGFEPEVLILGGGAGSGKSTGRKMLQTESMPELVYDTTISNWNSAVDKVEAALGADRRVILAFTARDPLEAFRAALSRASREEREFGSGRTVPLTVFVKQHPESRSNIDRLAERYADNPNVELIGIDNTHGPGKAKVVPLADLPRFDYNRLEEKTYEILRQEYAAGNISEAIYLGTLGDYRPKQPSGAAGAGAGRQSKRNGVGSQQGGQLDTSPSRQITGGQAAPGQGAD